MGLPEIVIEFKAKAETGIKRSGNGIVALILRDDTAEGTSYRYKNAADESIAKNWSETNQAYLKLAFEGSPKYVIVERISADDDYTEAKARLVNKKWNYLAVPGADESEVSELADWIIAQRSNKKTFKAVLPNCEANDEGIINFTTKDIVCGGESYTTAEYCARVAGFLAGLPMSQSATYQVFADVTGITESLTPDKDIDAGQFILINDGEKIKVGRGVNSLVTLSGNKTADMKKIKIVEGMDLIRDDIRTTFEENYVGENNSYDNKMMFVAAVNLYFAELAKQGVLYDEYENVSDIDIDAQTSYLAQKQDISEWSDDQIRKARTGAIVFIKGDIQFSDAAEDLQFGITMS